MVFTRSPTHTNSIKPGCTQNGKGAGRAPSQSASEYSCQNFVRSCSYKSFPSRALAGAATHRTVSAKSAETIIFMRMSPMRTNTTSSRLEPIMRQLIKAVCAVGNSTCRAWSTNRRGGIYLMGPVMGRSFRKGPSITGPGAVPIATRSL